MGRAVQTYLADNNGVWSDVPAIGTAITQLDAKLDDIESTTEQQETPIEGATQDKETLRDQLEEKTLFVASAVFSSAMAKNNHELAAEVDFTVTQLDRMAEQELANAAERTHTRATENFGAIKTDYKMEQADLDSLSATLTAFSEKMPQPRAKIAARAGITQTIPGKRRDLMSFLRQVLDRLMVRYRTINPQFYGGYQSARVIVDLKAKQPPTTPPTP